MSAEALNSSWVGNAAPARITGLNGQRLIANPPRGNNRMIRVVQNLKIAAQNMSTTVAVGTAGRCSDDDTGRGTPTWVKNPDKITVLNPDGWTVVWENPIRPSVHYHIADDNYSRGERIARACTHWAEGRWQPATGGEFTLRIWGNVCVAGAARCASLKEGAGHAILTPGFVNSFGYLATFGPGPNCGPVHWPTPDWQAAGGNPYVEWCDVIVSP